MKYTSALLASASGSVGGATFSRNRSGPYIRRKATPVNPATPFQVAVRNFMSQLSDGWTQILTASQRVGWEAYAAAVPVINPLGQSINLTGINMYVRSNLPRLQGANSRIDDAPTNFTLGSFSIASFEGVTGTGNCSVGFDNLDAWANEDNAFMYVYLSPSKNIGVTFYKGPYRFSGSIAGSATVAPTSPVIIPGPFLYITGQAAFGRAQVSFADGRLSPDIQLPFTGIV